MDAIVVWTSFPFSDWGHYYFSFIKGWSEDIWMKLVNRALCSCWFIFDTSSHFLVVGCKKKMFGGPLSMEYWRKAIFQNFVREKQWTNFSVNCVTIHMKLWSDTSFNLSFKADLVCNHSLFCYSHLIFGFIIMSLISTCFHHFLHLLIKNPSFLLVYIAVNVFCWI